MCWCLMQNTRVISEEQHEKLNAVVCDASDIIGETTVFGSIRAYSKIDAGEFTYT